MVTLPQTKAFFRWYQLWQPLGDEERRCYRSCQDMRHMSPQTRWSTNWTKPLGSSSFAPTVTPQRFHLSYTLMLLFHLFCAMQKVIEVRCACHKVTGSWQMCEVQNYGNIFLRKGKKDQCPCPFFQNFLPSYELVMFFWSPNPIGMLSCSEGGVVMIVDKVIKQTKQFRICSWIC